MPSFVAKQREYLSGRYDRGARPNPKATVLEIRRQKPSSSLRPLPAVRANLIAVEKGRVECGRTAEDIPSRPLKDEPDRNGRTEPGCQGWARLQDAFAWPSGAWAVREYEARPGSCLSQAG